MYQPHPYANIFPMMTDDEMTSLVKSMKENGYDPLLPIVLYDGMILDGRNRYAAAQKAGVEPTFMRYEGNDSLAYAIRLNLQRRHLDSTQRAVVANRLATMTKADGAKITHNVLGRGDASENFPIHVSQSQAAEMLNVSDRIIRTVKAVEQEAPELIPLMESGKMTAHEAMKEVKKQKREEQRKEMAEEGSKVEVTNRFNIYQDDIKTWTALKQYDVIITDPPYPKEYINLYEVLAIRAKEWLKPGGLLIAMAGQSYLNQIYEIMSRHMQYYWTACYHTPGQPTPLRQVNVNTNWKPLLIFSNGKYAGHIFGDVFKSDANDKDFHKWGQSISGMYDIVSKMSLKGQHILDPFCGAGTTGIAALKHDCFFDGIELLEENVNISKKRLDDYARNILQETK